MKDSKHISARDPFGNPIYPTSKSDFKKAMVDRLDKIIELLTKLLDEKKRTHDDETEND